MASFFLRRTQVKTEYLMSIESSDSLLEEIGAQALITASYQPPDSVLQAVDAVALNDVVQVCACNKDLKISAQVNRAQRMVFTHWPVVNVVPISLRCGLLQLKNYTLPRGCMV